MTTEESWPELDAILTNEFGTLPELIRFHAETRPSHPALIEGDRHLDYATLDHLVDRAAAALEREGVRPDDVVALCGANSIPYVVALLAALRLGAALAPLAPSTSAEALRLMLENCEARMLFADHSGESVAAAKMASHTIKTVSLDDTPGENQTGAALRDWLAPEGTQPQAMEPRRKAIFNIIYSSGTTGTPKGIVHTNALRWPQIANSALWMYRPDNVTLISTPLYSNTTLVSFLPALGGGGTVVLMGKFKPTDFLALAQTHRVTLAMLVPVQYRRLLEAPDFDAYDLSSFHMKFCTSAPFAAHLKAEILARWPGGLIEFYGMTEGGGSCMLAAHEHPDKLASVGQPMEGHDIRIISKQGEELGPGEIGEIVGHSAFMMTGYNKEPAKSSDAVWHDPTGKRFIRTGDIGRFDSDGFLTIMDRAKDTIISGGFNLYPSDLEAILLQHDAVAETAVVGVPSDRWGETPVAAVVLKKGATLAAEDLREWANARLGKTQRISALHCVSALPRNDIGKVSKKDLRARYLKSEM